MKEESKNMDEMELPELLKYILNNVESIQKESKESVNSKEQFLQKIQNNNLELDRKIEEIKSLSVSINRDISKIYEHERTEIKTLFDERLKEFNTITFNLSERDKKQLQKADDVLRGWWRFPTIISALSLGFAILTGFLAFNFYSVSVKSKEEIKGDIAKEMKAQNLIWIEKGDLGKLKENAELVKLWSERNPKDSKSLESFIKGYEAFNKEKK